MISDTSPPALDDSKEGEQEKFTWPPLLANGNLTKLPEIKPYCFNVNETEKPVLEYNLDMQHMFLENCYLLQELQPWLAILSIYGLTIGALWICALYKI